MSKIKLVVKMMRINTGSKKKSDYTHFQIQNTIGNNVIKTIETGIERNKAEEKDRNVSVKVNMNVEEIVGRLKRLEEHIKEIAKCNKRCQKFDS